MYNAYVKIPVSPLPKNFLSRLPDIIGNDSVKKILAVYKGKRYTTIRVNTLKIQAYELEQLLKVQKIQFEQVSWLRGAYILPSSSARELTETSLCKEGLLYIQNLSSMIPAIVLNPRKNEVILDITAAPGSKTTQISALMQNSGHIYACDSSRIRLYRMDANIRTLGVTNVEMHCEDAQNIWKKFPEHFDAAIADVPCSMEGRFSYNVPKSYQNWSVKKVKDLAEEQKWILRSALSAVKPGGRIVYSTCTLSPEENEGVIDWIIKKEKGAVEIESFTVEGLKFVSGLKNWKEKRYCDDMDKTIRILPSEYMEGFYVALLRKKKSNVPPFFSDMKGNFV